MLTQNIAQLWRPAYAARSTLFWLLCAVFTIATLFWQIFSHKQQLTYLFDAETLAKTSNITIYDLRYKQFDTQGHVSHLLESPMIQHIPRHNIHLLTTPHIIATEPQQDPWDIRADHATATEGGTQIDFNQHVRIRQKKQSTAVETLMSTESLSYFPSQKKATSDDDVTFTQAGNKIQSKGMIANLADNSIRLLSNARGHYEPDKG